MPARANPYAWKVALPWQPSEPQSRKIDRQLDSHHDLGVPVGGIGSGAISRGPMGGFNRWTIKAGQVDYFSQDVNGFAVWQRPAGGSASARALRPGGAIPGWRFDPEGEYAALFPKAWHSYQEGDLSLIIEQLSPVVPDLETDADLPVGLFRAHLRNAADTPLEAAVMFSFANLVGWFAGFRGVGHPGGVAGQRNEAADSDLCAGILMTRETAGPFDEGDGQILLGVMKDDGIEITRCPAFDADREGEALWQGFAADGRVSAPGDGWCSGGGFSEFPAAQPSGAIAARATLKPSETRVIDFCLVFDLPVIRFGQGRRWRRHYTARWGGGGNSAQAIADHALQHAQTWSDEIDRFHDAALSRLDLPDAAAHLPFNELYLLTDGLTVWTAPERDHPAHFGLIECPDYPLYNTLDLWVYAAAAVSELFPSLAQAVVTDYAIEVPKDDPEIRFHLKSTARMPRQRAGMLPHDLGAPNADPFIRANDYVYQDSSLWKDLNAMFAVTAWRAARTENAGYAASLLPAVSRAMDALSRFDRDGDGLIENDGFPDQTFDNVPMRGISAYCGGLWLSALRATAALAEKARDPVAAKRWRAMSATAEPAFEDALWAGTHFRVDSDGTFRDAVFAEQMYGPATARMLGLGDTVDPDKARTALATIYRRNFIEAGAGRGLVAITSAAHSSELYAPKGEEGLQWDEILVGFNYSFAAQLRVFGMEEECRTLMAALARELGPQRGLHFRTPAALHPTKPLFRAQMNLRPLGIWALALAADYRNG